MCRAALLLALSACGGARPADEPRETPIFVIRDYSREEILQHHMRTHYLDFDAVQRHLIAGRLSPAQDLAFLLTRHSSDPALAPWDKYAFAVSDSARALRSAKSLDEGLRQHARLAAACGTCHVAAGRKSTAPELPPLPAEEATTQSRMLRHQWAAARLAEGITTPSEEHWRAGLEILAREPLPFSPATDAPLLAARMHRLATDALADQTQTTLEVRAAAYGEMLVTCVGCHTSTRLPQATK